MRTRTRFRKAIPIGVVVSIVAMAAFALATLCFMKPRAVSGDTKEAVMKDPPIDLSRLSDRSVWHQVNATPYRISSALNVLCDAPRPARVDEERKRNPHASTVVTVFVNEAGRAAMFSPTPTVFPMGSVIVKQKFDGLFDAKKVVLHTVMLKREPGYNRDAGDWEYAVVAGDGKEVQARGALANCIACHAPQSGSDFVFRSYLDK